MPCVIYSHMPGHDACAQYRLGFGYRWIQTSGSRACWLLRWQETRPPIRPWRIYSSGRVQPNVRSMDGRFFCMQIVRVLTTVSERSATSLVTATPSNYALLIHSRRITQRRWLVLSYAAACRLSSQNPCTFMASNMACTTSVCCLIRAPLVVFCSGSACVSTVLRLAHARESMLSVLLQTYGGFCRQHSTVGSR